MRDHELLKSAALSAGYEYREGYAFEILDDGIWRKWDPLQSNADAFLLAIKLGLHITRQADNTVEVTAPWAPQDEVVEVRESYESDSIPAARLAIVKVAAMLAKNESCAVGLVKMACRSETPHYLNSEELISSLAWALSMVLDGTQNHDIQNKTGLSDEDTEKLIAIRAIADEMFFGK